MIEHLAAPPPERLARLARVHAEAFKGQGRGWSAAEIGDLACSGHLVVDNADQGFAIASLVGEEAELLTIAVAPSARRKGLAATLLDMLVETLAMNGAARLFLEVAVDNEAATALYRKTGFEEVGRRPGYYKREGGRIDALIMAKRL